MINRLVSGLCGLYGIFSGKFFRQYVDFPAPRSKRLDTTDSYNSEDTDSPLTLTIALFEDFSRA